MIFLASQIHKRIGSTRPNLLLYMHFWNNPVREQTFWQNAFYLLFNDVRMHAYNHFEAIFFDHQNIKIIHRTVKCMYSSKSEPKFHEYFTKKTFSPSDKSQNVCIFAFWAPCLRASWPTSQKCLYSSKYEHMFWDQQIENDHPVLKSIS